MWKLVDSDAGDHHLWAECELRGIFSFDAEQGWRGKSGRVYITFGATGARYVSVDDAYPLWHVEGEGENEHLVVDGVRWVLKYFTYDTEREIIHDDLECVNESGTTADSSVTLRIDLHGTLIREAELLPGAEVNDVGVRTYRYVPSPEPLGDMIARWRERAESYNVSLSFAGESDNWVVPVSQTYALDEISINAYGVVRQYAQTIPNSAETVWVSGTYGRSRAGACRETRTLHLELPPNEQSGFPGSNMTFQAGNGSFSVAGGVLNGYSNWGEGVTGWDGGFTFVDYEGPYALDYSESIANMDGTDRSPMRLATPQRHSRLVKTPIDQELPEGAVYTYASNHTGQNDQTRYAWSWTYDDCEEIELTDEPFEIEFAGRVQFRWPSLAWNGSWETFSDVPYGADIGYDLGRVTLPDVRPTWGGDDWVEGSAREPAHPPWEPQPAPVGYDPETGEPGYSAVDPPWYDDLVLLNGSGLEIENALQIELVGPGEFLPGVPLNFADARYEWDNGQVVGDYLEVAVGAQAVTADSGDILQTWTRLNGARFAVVRWQANRAGATAQLWFGDHCWTLTAEGTGEQQTEIDLAVPHETNVAGDGAMQSIAPYEKPLDLPVWNESAERPERGAESSYDWQYPAGWGVGVVTRIKLVCETPETTYQFRDVRLKRKPVQDGGFAVLEILPQAGPWSDTRLYSDFAYGQSGDQNWYSDPRPVALIPKGCLIVDGVVAWELVAGHTQVDEDYNSPTGLRQWYVYYRLSRPIDAAGATTADHQGIGLPLDSYVEPTAYAINGIATITPYPADWQSEYALEVYALVAFLEGGRYWPDAQNRIVVPLRIRPHWWQIAPGSRPLPAGTHKRFRGCVQGIALAAPGRAASGGTVTVSTPDASPGAEETQAVEVSHIGWWESKALNTRGPAHVEGTGDSLEITLRSRFYSRIAGVTAALLLAGISIDEEPAGRIYLAYAQGGGIRIIHSDQFGEAWSTPVIAATNGCTPAISACWLDRRQCLCLIYVRDGHLLRRTSADEGETWSDEMELFAGTRPVICHDRSTGMKLLFYRDGSDLKVRRSTDNFATWIEAAQTIADDAADDCIAAEWVGDRAHRVMVVYRSTSGSLRTIYSSANGLPPYEE